MAWNVFKIDSSKIGFYQNFLIYCDKFDNKIFYCLSRFRAGNFSPAPTSSHEMPNGLTDPNIGTKYLYSTVFDTSDSWG